MKTRVTVKGTRTIVVLERKPVATTAEAIEKIADGKISVRVGIQPLQSVRVKTGGSVPQFVVHHTCKA